MENIHKVFRPKGIVSVGTYILAAILLVFTVVSGIYVFIESEEIWFTVLVAICAACLLVMAIRLLISHSCKKIVLNTDTIYVKKDRRGGFRVLQNEINLKYSEINDIKLIVTATDTNGQEQFGLVTPMPSIYFECNNDKYKMINVYDYSKKQRIEIMNEIIKRVQALGKLLECPNGEELIKQANEQYFRSKKKK